MNNINNKNNHSPAEGLYNHRVPYLPPDTPFQASLADPAAVVLAAPAREEHVVVGRRHAGTVAQHTVAHRAVELAVAPTKYFVPHVCILYQGFEIFIFVCPRH